MNRMVRKAIVPIISITFITSAFLFPYIIPLITEEDSNIYFLETNKIRQSPNPLENIGGRGVKIINASDYQGENDTERLQAALDDVPPEGAIVFIPAGIWTAAGLTAKSNTTILGENGTIMQRPENTTVPFITFENASNFAVVNITFDGRNIENAYGISIIDGKLFRIERNTFLNIKKNAVKVTVSPYGTSENFQISNNIFNNSQNAPILLFGEVSKRAIRNFLVANNLITHGSDNGKIGIAFSGNGIIENNTILDSEHGIATRCVSNIIIRRNFIKNVTAYGIYLGTQLGDEGTFNISITENVILYSGTGIARYYGNYPIVNAIITNNIFTNNKVYDILADFPGTFFNNTITSNSSLIITDPGASFFETWTITGNIFMPGDLDFNLKIDIFDIGAIAIAYGASQNSPNWDPSKDVIKDGTIDIKDISFIAKNYGYVCKVNESNHE